MIYLGKVCPIGIPGELAILVPSLLSYYDIINTRMRVCKENALQSEEGGGQNSLRSNNVIEDIPSESWDGRVKEVVLVDYSDENRGWNLSYARRGVK